MDKIKSKMHMRNKHFVWGLSFVVFSLVASIVWGLIYAEDTVSIPTVPLTPSNLSYVVNNNSIVLTWTNNSTNQDKFNISRRTNGGSLISIAMPSGPEPTSYTDSTVTAGNTYDYQVEACLSGTGCSYMTEVTGISVPLSTPTTTNTSTTTTIIPSAPSDLSYGTVTSSLVPLTWTDNASNEDKFNVERKLSSASTWSTLIQITIADTHSYNDTTVMPGYTYDYRVQACLSGTGCSDYTTVTGVVVGTITSGGGGGVTTTTITTTTTVPTAPSGFETYTTLTPSMTVIPLRWTDNSSNETSFVIEKKLNTSGTYAPLSSVGANLTYYTDSYSIIKDVLYDYRIKACLSNSTCSDYVYLLGVKIPLTTTVGNNLSNGSLCTGLNLNLNDGKTTYTAGQSVSYTWTCNPTGSTSTVSIWLNKPDGSMTNLSSTSGNTNQTLNFSTSNFVPGQYVLKACLGTSCSTYGGIVTTQMFSIVATGTTIPSTTSTTPTAPTNLTATVSGSNVTLNWTDNSNNEAGFKIYRGPVWTDIGNVGPNVTTFTDSGRPAGTYTYRLNAFNSSYVYSPISNDATAVVSGTTAGLNTTPASTNTSIPLAPSNLRLDSIVIPYNISLSWNDNSNNEDKFIIEKKLSSALVWSSLAQVGTNILHYIDTKVVSNTPYDYRISACLSGTGCSSFIKLEKVYSTIANTLNNTNPVTSTEQAKLVIPTTPTKTIPTTATETIIPKTTTPTRTITDATTGLSTTRIYTDTTTTTPNVGGALITTTEIKTPTPLEIPKDIIESVTSALNIVPQNVPEVKTDVNQTEQEKIEIVKEEAAKQEIVQEQITRLVYQDTNKDGISDYDSKYVYNIDPVKDSPISTYEGKSITAGEKILLGFDPGKKELEKVVVEEPTTTKSEVVVPSYKVREVALTEKKEVQLKGQALPNSFITLYIYSTPIMVTVKTDSNGEWQYTLNKELENGNHTVYTATVNNTGNIVAKSTPFTFVKTAEAVTLQDIPQIVGIDTPTTASIAVERPGFFEIKNVFILVIGFFMILGITLILIGLLSKRKMEV